MTYDTAGFVSVGKASHLRSSSARHHITLRHCALANRYHSLLLFSFPKPPSDDGEASQGESGFYCMEAICPHLGAPLENASIYDAEEDDDIEDAVIVCPWHSYDFSLKTGESSTGLKACVYAVKEDEGRDTVYVQEPALEVEEDGQGKGWEVIEVRPVSESSSSGQQDEAIRHLHSAMEHVTLQTDAEKDYGEICDPEPLPVTLVEWAVVILKTPEPRLKVEYTRRAAHAFRTGKCRSIGGGRLVDGDWQRADKERPPAVPPRLDSAKIVEPGKAGKRGKGGSERSRIAMLHSLANIEQWAIDLAWDIIARAPELYSKSTSSFGHTKKLPLQFYSDFVKVAQDEAKHFTLLQYRLADMGARFGDLPVHHGLWDSAAETMHSLDARLSIIHLVHEARGLDANPLTIKKFDNAGDKSSVEILTTIHLDEVTHVSAGHRWLTYICAEAGQEPVAVFRRNVRQHFAGKLKGPFNASDRSKAGLTKEYYEDLIGEKGSVVGVARSEVPGG